MPASSRALTSSPAARASHNFAPAGSLSRRLPRPRVFTNQRASVTTWPSHATVLDRRAKSTIWLAVSAGSNHSICISSSNGRSLYWNTASDGALVSRRSSAGSSEASSFSRFGLALATDWRTWNGLTTWTNPRSPCTPSGWTRPGTSLPPRAFIGCSKVSRSVEAPRLARSSETTIVPPSRRQVRTPWPSTARLPASSGMANFHSPAGDPMVKKLTSTLPTTMPSRRV